MINIDTYVETLKNIHKNAKNIKNNIKKILGKHKGGIFKLTPGISLNPNDKNKKLITITYNFEYTKSQLDSMNIKYNFEYGKLYIDNLNSLNKIISSKITPSMEFITKKNFEIH